MRATTVLAFLALALGSGSVAHASFTKSKCDNFKDAGFASQEEEDAFLAKLKTAETAEDFAKLCTFPMKVNFGVADDIAGGRHHIILLNEDTVKQKFKDIFTEKVIETAHKQDAGGKVCNYQGIALGHGNIWIGKKKDRVGIYTINQP